MKTKSTLTITILSTLAGVIALSSGLLSQSPAKTESGPDLVMTQHLFAGQAKTPNTITMSIKGSKFRTDNDTTSTSIIDTESGDMTTLMHEQKMVTTMNMKALQALPNKESPVKIPETKLTATGQQETIDGYECEIYTSENSGMVVKMWIAKKYPGFEKLKKALKPMEKMSGAGAPKTPEVPGMMLKSEYEQSGIKFVTKLVSITETKLSDDQFKAPSDYKALAQ